ncbi:hypothetical protein JL722_3520 [Aureococcus anophagefferens]|nr:hypothetical protein JL722_3520 [Aureococcus anophagefferens]
MPLTDPKTRVGDYDGRLAQYLVDLHDNKATFDFCGGMLFQLVLSDALRSRLLEAAEQPEAEQPEVYDAATNRMAKMPGYAKNADADNVRLFHGREVRNVPTAAGGMNFVLHLSLANGEDAEGWSRRRSPATTAGATTGTRGARARPSRPRAAASPSSARRRFTLHHRFWHLDRTNQLWLSAETAARPPVRVNWGGESS